jgi:ABC-type multidrug transport system ATPase subunit
MNNPDRVTYFAATDTRGKRIPFGIKQKDRARHMYLVGKTGMGKSTLIENMAIQDIRNGEGLAFIDPHGDAAERLLNFIPENRIKDVVYFAPFDLERPIAFNVMEDVSYERRHLVVAGLLSTLKKMWADVWSPRFEYILTNILLALLEYPHGTLLGASRMFTDSAFRTDVLSHVTDPLVKDFFEREFTDTPSEPERRARLAIENKIQLLAGNPFVRSIIGQATSSFSLRDMMDGRKILIANLSRGLIGEGNMRLLGSILTTSLFLAATGRADVGPEKLSELPNFFYYVDEFQNFANETFASILSEARKYKLSLVISHQYLEQMEQPVRAAVFGNAGTIISFRVGPFDAEALQTFFAPEFSREDLVHLGTGQIYLTLMIDGVASRPFSAIVIPPIEYPKQSYREDVKRASRDTFGLSKTMLERQPALSAELTKVVKQKEMQDKETEASRRQDLRNVLQDTGALPSERHPYELPEEVLKDLFKDDV